MVELEDYIKEKRWIMKENCIDCGDPFPTDEIINGRCENCFDNYRDEMKDA